MCQHNARTSACQTTEQQLSHTLTQARRESKREGTEESEGWSKRERVRVEGSGRERETGRVCRCAFVCESLEAFGDGNWKLSLLLSMAPSPEMTATGALLEAPEHIIGVFP